MLKRTISSFLEKVAQQLPVVAILGPRQSGKTTLARMVFKDHTYISLEDLDHRMHATQDPRGFLATYNNNAGIILDEIQYAPTILSYIQTITDLNPKPGSFVLTGSQYFLVNQAVSQTLAGRMALITLLPLSLHELKENSALPVSLDEYMFKGCYPRLYAHSLDASFWYSGYIKQYIERDVREVATVGELIEFKTFLHLCAGRVGQLLSLSSLANDCGISVRKVQQWLSLLQASYIIFLLQPYHKNFNKRLVKTPKLYFYDTGVACSLLGLEKAEQVLSHYLRGGLFENAMISDLYKQAYNVAKEPHLYFWRNNHGHEIDCVIEQATKITAIEYKSGKTISSHYYTGLEYWQQLSAEEQEKFVVYAGDQEIIYKQNKVISWVNSDLFIK